MSRDRAAYMRDYRKRRRVEVVSGDINLTFARYENRIAELEAEVSHLKRQLARPTVQAIVDRFNSKPFTPVPKGK